MCRERSACVAPARHAVFLVMVVLAVMVEAAAAAAWRRRPGDKPGCGFSEDCHPSYDSSHLNASATAVAPAWRERLAEKTVEAVRGCAGSAPTSVDGGYCLPATSTWTRAETLADGSVFMMPPEHWAGDKGILKAIVHRVVEEGLTLNDFGAGVGQYGKALLASAKMSGAPKAKSFAYHGFDGAGNIAERSGGFLQFFDLVIPLGFPRADWVMSLEVGEHIPPAHEAMLFRNLHAHNCVGVILSWAVLNQNGYHHINNHATTYIEDKMKGLGYYVDAAFTKEINDLAKARVVRGGSGGPPEKSCRAYRRYTPLTGHPTCNFRDQRTAGKGTVLQSAGSVLTTASRNPRHVQGFIGTVLLLVLVAMVWAYQMQG